MIQKTVKVKSAETLPTKDQKKTYLSVTLTDGNRDNKYSVFDPALQKTLQDANKSGESVSVGLEKEGNFWNIKSAEISMGEDDHPPIPPKSTRTIYPKNDDDIMLQVALKAIVDLHKHHYVPAGKVDVGIVAQDTNELFASLIMMRPKKDKNAKEYLS